jgi:hypothetical protein
MKMVGHKTVSNKIYIIDKGLADFFKKVVVVTLLDKNRLSLISPIEDVIKGVGMHHNAIIYRDQKIADCHPWISGFPNQNSVRKTIPVMASLKSCHDYYPCNLDIATNVKAKTTVCHASKLPSHHRAESHAKQGIRAHQYVGYGYRDRLLHHCLFELGFQHQLR